jgi:adenylosuccinate synthase
MAVTVVVGGQFGSEGKGKVALLLARERRARAVVRIGGSNSGHTGVDSSGRPVALRQLPTAALLPDVLCILGPGSYVDPDVLLDEVARVGLAPERLVIDPRAILITDHDRAVETSGPLGKRIGSTCSGTGAAVQKRIARRSVDDLVGGSRRLEPFVRDTVPILRALLDAHGRVVVEGTQGFGLSVLHSPHFPHVTSRDTTAAAAVSEAGLSLFDVDEVVLVLRAHPIRVAGNSGPFGAEELSWDDVALEGGHRQLGEFTTVTGRVRRVARFDPELVRRAISVNQPSLIVLNHVDYVDADSTLEQMTGKATRFVEDISASIEREIDLVGLGPDSLLVRRPLAEPTRQPAIYHVRSQGLLAGSVLPS